MPLTLRPAQADDAPALGHICFTAFSTLNQKHNFPPDFPSPDISTGLISWILARPDVYSVVAELDGRVIGSNFLWLDTPIAGVGPITIDPSAQNASVGRRLMENVLAHAAKLNVPGVRLVQAAFHNRSLSLYTKLGFDVREPLACINGTPLGKPLPGFPVRRATESDLPACNALCRAVHGHDRSSQLLLAIANGTATVVERDGQITAYATEIGFFGHAVALTNDDLMALISHAPQFTGPGFLLPTRNSRLFRWCLQQDLRVSQPMTLMSTGLYNHPAGAFLPSILY